MNQQQMGQQQMNQEQKKPGGINRWPMPFKIIGVVAVLAVLLNSINRCEQKQDGTYDSRTAEQVRQDAVRDANSERDKELRDSYELRVGGARTAEQAVADARTELEEAKKKLSDAKKESEGSKQSTTPPPTIQQLVQGEKLPDGFVVLDPNDNPFEEFFDSAMRELLSSNPSIEPQWIGILESERKAFRLEVAEMQKKSEYAAEEYFWEKFEELGDQDSYLYLGRATQRMPSPFTSSDFKVLRDEMIKGLTDSSSSAGRALNRGFNNAEESIEEAFGTDVNLGLGKFSIVEIGENYATAAAVMSVAAPEIEANYQQVMTMTMFPYGNSVYLAYTYSDIDDEKALKVFTDWLKIFFN